jgi:hypothetical protein
LTDGWAEENAHPVCHREVGVMADKEPTPFELWQKSDGEINEYLRLMREHGLLVRGKPEPLPCGWPRLSHLQPSEDAE